MGRGHKVGIALAVTMTIVCGGLVLVDRFAVGMAQGRIAQQVKTELAARSITTTGDPKVTIVGFPFLAQVVGGEYEKITIGIVRPKTSGITFETIDLAVERVAADATAVLNGSGQVTAAKVTGTAVMGWGAVRDALKVTGLPSVDASAAELTVSGGAVRLRLPIVISGQKIVFTATGTLQVQDGVVRLKMTDVKAEGVPPTAAVQRMVEQYRKMFSAEVDIPALPYGLTITTVETSEAGISVIAGAEHVRLAG